jgi:hypothetical protein
VSVKSRNLNALETEDMNIDHIQQDKDDDIKMFEELQQTMVSLCC